MTVVDAALNEIGDYLGGERARQSLRADGPSPPIAVICLGQTPYLLRSRSSRSISLKM